MRVEQIGRATLYCGDSIEILPNIGSVDAVVTSPPYDDLREYGETFTGVDCLGIITCLSKIVADGGVVVWNVADAVKGGSETGTSFKQALHAMECGLNLHDTMIYAKSSFSFPEANRYPQTFEYMFVFSNGRPGVFNPIKDRRNKWAGTVVHGTQRQKNGELKKRDTDFAMSEYGVRYNVWKIENKLMDTGHPAPMPYQMAHDHILTWTNEGAVVLDPFMGSGTTGMAAVKLGRDFIGVELEPKYFDIACRRIEDAQRQGDMFIGSAA